MNVASAPLRHVRLPHGVVLLGLAVAYAVLGMGSLWISIPPYLAAAFMPSVGIALGAMMAGGYRMAPGVWLGGTCLTLWLSYRMQGTLNLPMAVSAVFSGGAAALQVAVGLFLVRRAIGREPKLQKLREILLMLWWGGPVACLVNASLTSPLLLAAGVLPVSEGAQLWFLIWACDVLGVLVMLPITLAALGWPAGAWAGRRLTVLVPMVACLIGIAALFAHLARFERGRPQSELLIRAERTAHLIEARLARSLQSALAAGLFMESVDRGRADLFHHYMAGIRKHQPELRRVIWAPRVATGASESFQVAFVDPPTQAREAARVDLLSDPFLRRAVLSAVLGGELTVLPQFLLPGASEADAVPGMLLPIHEASGAVAGVLALELQLQEIVRSSNEPTQAAALEFTLWDVTIPEAFQPLSEGTEPPTWDRQPLVQVPLKVGGRQWEIRAHALPNRIRGFSHWQLWGLMVSFLLLDTMLAVLLMVQGGEKARVAALVAERTETLHQRELFLSAVLQSALDGLLTLDAQGRVRSANQAACQLLGFSASEWEGLRISEVLPSLDWASLLAALASLPRESLGLRREVQARRRDGSGVPVELALSNASTAGQRTYVLLLHDVSERNRVVRMKDEFVSTVSHELRTPLTSILGSLSLINHAGLGQVADVAPQLLTIAESNAQRLLALINDLLDADKLEAGMLMLTCKPLELGPLLARSLEENRGYAARFQVSLHLEAGTGAGAWASLDGNRFAQVMSNLLSNAIKFSPQGGRVEVGLTPSQEHVEVTVRDFGAGIPVEFQEQMFRKFSQADSSDTRRQRGTGLGLYLTRMLVEGMDGTIRFQTATGQGTTFFVRLPRIPVPAPRSEA